MATIAEIRQQFPMYQDVPDGELVRGLHNKFYSDMPYDKFLKSIDFSKPVDPTEGMRAGQKFAAGYGSAVQRMWQGIKQGFNIGDQGKLQQEIDETQKLEGPLMSTGAGAAGNFVGTAAPIVAASAFPGMQGYAGAIGLGGASGYITPTSGKDSRLMNTAFGAGAGTAGQFAGNLLGRALRPVANQLNPEEARLAQVAARENIPLTAGQATGSKPLKLVESTLENMPLTSESQLGIRQAQKEAFNRAVLGRAGIEGKSLATSDVLVPRKAELGKTFEDIATRNAIDFNRGNVVADLARIEQEASRRLSNPAPIKNAVEDILNDVSSGVMPGTKYQGWRETLRVMSKGNDTEAHYAAELKKTLDKAFSSQISSADSEAFKQASREYGNLKTIMGSMGGAGLEGVKGNISPAQLGQALASQIGREGKALGRGSLNDLQRVGRMFVSETLPDSATAQRAMWTHLLQGNVAGMGIGSTAGAGYQAMTGGDPLKGALAGGAAGALGGPALAIGAPKLAQALMNSRAGQAYLREGLVPPLTKHITEGHRVALANALRAAALAAPRQ